jgi:hypothetical protein
VAEIRLYDPMICNVHHQVMGNTSEATVFAEIYQCETAQNLAAERQRKDTASANNYVQLIRTTLFNNILSHP